MTILSLILWIVYMLSLKKMLHIMQLEGYKNGEFLSWLGKNKMIAFRDGLLQLLATFLTYLFVMGICLSGMHFLETNMTQEILTRALSIGLFFVFLVYLIMNIRNILKNRKEVKSAKKPLVYTARLKRLIFANFVILMLLEVLLMEYTWSNIFFYLLAHSFIIFTIPANMILANFFIDPTEQLINHHYINDARRKINKNKNLIRIGITGSYGKTSTKFILETILKEKYRVLATPESYNTTMGNVRTIREKLKPEHEIFISEMGARKRYDIQEICNFVRPNIGIITSIGPQHLETFKKIENVVKTKAELIEGLTVDGTIFLPEENPYCYELYQKEKREKYLYSTKDKRAYVYLKEVKVSERGSNFEVQTQDGTLKCTTKLLGEHNVQNILGCIAIAKYLGLTNEQIQSGIEKIEPIPHRLQLLPTNNGTTVIDDAFNSNPVGSKMALDILKKFEGRKIIITPGMVELGEKEYSLNKEFGRQMAASVDITILVGEKRSKPIVEGLKEKKFTKEAIYIVPTLEEATRKLAELTKKRRCDFI